MIGLNTIVQYSAFGILNKHYVFNNTISIYKNIQFFPIITSLEILYLAKMKKDYKKELNILIAF
jgi:hypothetical protein